MGARCSCSRRKQEPQPQGPKEVEVVVSAAGGRTVKLLLGTKYKTGSELRTRAAALFHVPQDQAALMCGSEKVDDEEVLLETRHEALQGKPPQLQLLRTRRHMALSGTQGGGVTLWDVERGEVANALPNEHLSGIWGVDINWETHRMVTASDDNTLLVWDIDRVRTKAMRGHSDSVTGVSVEWSKGYVLSSSMDKSIKMWNLATHACIKTLEGHTDGIQCLSVDWQSQCALSGSWDKTLKLWDLESNECKKTLEGHDSFILCLKVDWAARRAFSGARGHNTNRVCRGYERVRKGGSNLSGKNLKLWDIDDGVCLKTFSGHDKDILGVDMDWASKRGLSASADKIVNMWDLEGGDVLRSFRDHTEFVGCVQADWAAKRMLTGAGNHELRLWNLESGECLSIWNWEGGDTKMGRGQVRCVILEPYPSPPAGSITSTSAQPEPTK